MAQLSGLPSTSTGGSSCYFLAEGYKLNRSASFYDDTTAEDKWQREVYVTARQLADRDHLERVVDFGTGSGFKLLQNFESFETIGYDLPPTVNHLRKTYPDRNWATIGFDDFSDIDTDLFIASDVIEHLQDPAILLKAMKTARYKLAVFSTPARELLVSRRGHRPLGPPKNPGHVCEWTTKEFEQFIGNHFEIEEHCISNLDQCTQVIITRCE